MNHRSIVVAGLSAALFIGLAIPVGLQAGVFDDPENLEILPDDIPPERLRSIMIGFSKGTGHRCADCHVGEKGAPLDTYDFASDEKEDKRIAREMLKMTMAINNDWMAEIDDDPVQVKCVTCHRGVKHPRMTGEVLTRAADRGGVEGLQKTYREMRTQYYGTHSYDFSDQTLGEVAQGLLMSDKSAEAVAMLDMMLEDDPESFNANFLYGEISAGQGNAAAAAGYYRKAIEIDPESAAFVQPKLDALEAE